MFLRAAHAQINKWMTLVTNKLYHLLSFNLRWFLRWCFHLQELFQRVHFIRKVELIIVLKVIKNAARTICLQIFQQTNVAYFYKVFVRRAEMSNRQILYKQSLHRHVTKKQNTNRWQHTKITKSFCTFILRNSFVDNLYDSYKLTPQYSSSLKTWGGSGDRGLGSLTVPPLDFELFCINSLSDSFPGSVMSMTSYFMLLESSIIKTRCCRFFT